MDGGGKGIGSVLLAMSPVTYSLLEWSEVDGARGLWEAVVSSVLSIYIPIDGMCSLL
jgi:hypothetical protein